MGAALLAGGGWGLYRFGQLRAGVAYDRAIQTRDEYRAQLEQANERIEALRAQSARLATAQEIDRHANTAVKETLARLQEENQQLREELQFYRNIVSPSQAESGVQIQHFGLVPAGRPHQYHFTVTLIRIRGPKQRQERARGSVELVIEGTTRDGSPQVLVLDEIATSDVPSMTYAIKYFKKFEGDIALPAGFQPVAAIARLKPRGGKQDPVEKKIEWPARSG